RSATRAKGRVAYRLIEEGGGAATRVEVAVAFSLAGPLAQFSRGGIVTDLAARLTAAFADNLQARLDAEASGAAAPAAAKLDAGGLLVSVLWARIKAALAALFGRPHPPR
ncbi:MAG: carbon monoxide dehydrogenase, partial [Proteobacteria bacterium]|nr:carbon monoxide dehydrogenase [Pseudomonadota bacterium]